MTKRQIEKLAAALEARQNEVAEARDRLDDTIAEFKELREHCRDAYDDLQRARDALSQLV